MSREMVKLFRVRIWISSDIHDNTGLVLWKWKQLKLVLPKQLKLLSQKGAGQRNQLVACAKRSETWFLLPTPWKENQPSCFAGEINWGIKTGHQTDHYQQVGDLDGTPLILYFTVLFQLGSHVFRLTVGAALCHLSVVDCVFALGDSCAVKLSHTSRKIGATRWFWTFRRVVFLAHCRVFGIVHSDYECAFDFMTEKD